MAINFNDYVFIDFGSGKGDVLLLAAEYGFKRVIGVEYSETLAEIASARVRGASCVAAQTIECICADASTFDLPDDSTVLYLYNPFQATVMDRVVRNIEKSLCAVPRDLWIVYVNPWEHRKFVRSPHLKTVGANWDVPSWEFCVYRSISSESYAALSNPRSSVLINGTKSDTSHNRFVTPGTTAVVTGSVFNEVVGEIAECDRRGVVLYLLAESHSKRAYSKR